MKSRGKIQTFTTYYYYIVGFNFLSITYLFATSNEWLFIVVLYVIVVVVYLSLLYDRFFDCRYDSSSTL